MNKYGNKKTTIDNITFASQKEASRYNELKLLEKAGEIRNLVLQPRYELQKAFEDENGVHHKSIFYVADFSYLDKKHKWEIVVEDCKGARTPVYKLKKKLFLFRYFCHFLET